MHIPRSVRAASGLYDEGLDDADDNLRDRLVDLLRSDPQVRRAVTDLVTGQMKAAVRATALAPRGGIRG